MPFNFSKTKLNVPGWVQEVLDVWASETKPHFAVEVAETLRTACDTHKEMNDEDFKGYYAEWAAFLFSDLTGRKSTWNTHFGPMMTFGDTASPDLKELDEEIILHWGKRATSVKSPIMRARYADLVWDMKQTVTGKPASHEFALTAIDAYEEATKHGLSKNEMDGVGWLKRAFELSLSLGDKHRAKRIVATIFDFYDTVAKPKRIGVWIFPFDVLYEHRELLAPEQEARLIDDLEKMLALTSGAGKDEEFDPYGAEAAADRLARHYKRKGDTANAERVVKTYAGAFLRVSKQANSLLAMAWLQPVIERLQQEGLKKEAEELQLLSEEKGKGITADLRTVEVKTEIKPEEIEALDEQLVGGNDLHSALARTANFYVPKAQTARKLVDTLKTSAPLLSMIPIVMVNRDGRTTAQIGSVEEDEEGRLYQQLNQTIDFYQPFLMHTLAKLRAKFSPSADQILEFLCLSPLFKKDEARLLKEGLEAYFKDDFIKAIHVLVPQVEHVLRNFLGVLGIPTLKTIRNLGVMDAKGMNDVPSDERMREVLTENLWRYLTLVYIDRRGMNLRNDLAHGLLAPIAFNKGVADRVFHTLLALSLLRAGEAKKATESAPSK